MNHDTEKALPTPDSPRRGRALLAILLLALATRVYRAVELPAISRDGAFLVTFAKQLGERPAFFMKAQKKQPGYSAMLLGVHGLVGPQMTGPPPMVWQRCGQSISVLFGVAGVALIYVVGRRLFDARIGLWAAALAAFWPGHVEVSGDVLTDAPHLAVYLLALLLADRAIERGCLSSAAATGVVAGLAYWIRQEALGVPLALAVLALFCPTVGSTRRRILIAGAALIAFAVVVAPLAAVTGSVMHNKSLWELLTGAPGEAIARVIESSSMPPSSIAPASDLTALAVTVTPLNVPWRMFIAWCESGRWVLSTLTLIALAWPAVPTAPARLRRLVLIAVALQLAATGLRGARLGEISERYLMIPVALALPWAAAGLVQIIAATRRIATGRSPTLMPLPAVFATRRPTPSWFSILVFILIASPMIWFCLRPPATGEDGLRRAGDWLREHAAPEDRILAAPALGPVAFYADRPREWPFDPIAQPIPCAETRWCVRRTGAAARTPSEAAFLNELQSKLGNRTPVARFGLPHGDGLNVFDLRASVPGKPHPPTSGR